MDLIRQAARDRADNVPPRLAVNAIRIPWTESPDAHEEKCEFGLADRTWLESMYRKYGRRSLWVGSHIDARIPDVDAEQLIASAWLDSPQPSNGRQFRRVIPSTPPGGSPAIWPRESGRDSTCIMVRRRLGLARGRAGRRRGLAGSSRDGPRLVTRWNRTARPRSATTSWGSAATSRTTWPAWHHDGDPLRRGGQAARHKLLRQPAHRGRLEAAQSAGYDPPCLWPPTPARRGPARLAAPIDATAGFLLLLWRLLCPAGR